MGGGTLNKKTTERSSYTSLYPLYDPTLNQVETVPLTVPELPPRPQAYTHPYQNIQTPPLLHNPYKPYPYAHHVLTPMQYHTVNPHNPFNTVNTSTAVDNKTTSLKNYLIYAKSGFYLKYNNPEETSVHGFFVILSSEENKSEVMIGWIPEYSIDPCDILQFVECDGQLPNDDVFPLVNISKEQEIIIQLKQVDSLYINPPSLFTLGSIIITSSAGEVHKPIWYSTQEHNRSYKADKETWPGFNIIDILNAFMPLTRSQEMQHVYIIKQKNPHPSLDTLQEGRMTLLERFSKITQLSRDTASHALTIIPHLKQSALNEYSLFSQYIQQWSHQKIVPETSDDMSPVDGPMPVHTRRQPVMAEEWITLFDEHGVLNVPVSKVKEMIFCGGLDPDIRIEAWKFLLNIYPWDSTFDEREAIRLSRREAYYVIKAKWFDNTEVRNSRHFLEEKHRIDKDVHRTDRTLDAFKEDDLPNPDTTVNDRTNANLEIMKDILVSYNYHKTELGYVQGMSDLLAPLFIAMGEEYMAFWGFTQFMERVQSNFYMDQSGMHGQLSTLGSLVQFMDPQLHKRLETLESSNFLFCFRWLLIWFKREFVWEDVIRLWEVLWTNHLSDKMVLFIALAVIDTHRTQIMEEINAFDELLKYMNDQSEKIPLEETLERAEVLFYQFEQKIRAMQQKKSILEQRLKLRYVWNSEERPLILADLDRTRIAPSLLSLLHPPAH